WIDASESRIGEGPSDGGGVAEREADEVFGRGRNRSEVGGFSGSQPKGFGELDFLDERNDLISDFVAFDRDDGVVKEAAFGGGKVEGTAGAGGDQVLNAVVDAAVEAVDVAVEGVDVFAAFRG